MAGGGQGQRAKGPSRSGGDARSWSWLVTRVAQEALSINLRCMHLIVYSSKKKKKKWWKGQRTLLKARLEREQHEVEKASAITCPRCNSLDRVSNSQQHQVTGKKGLNGDPPRALTKQRWVGAGKTGLGGDTGHQTRAPQHHSELQESRQRSRRMLVPL